MQKIRRPRPGATALERIRFSEDMRDALDALGVKPGEDFYLTATPGGEARARRGDPETSRQAAASVDNLTDRQKGVLWVFERWDGAMTDERLVALYEDAARDGLIPKQSPSGIRSRRSELAKAGLLTDTGGRAPLASGRMAILWDKPDPPSQGELLQPAIHQGGA